MQKLILALTLTLALITSAEAFNVGDRVKLGTDANPHNSRSVPNSTATPIGSIPATSEGLVTEATVPDQAGSASTFTKVNWDDAALADGYMTSNWLVLIPPPPPPPPPAPTGGLSQEEKDNIKLVIQAAFGNVGGSNSGSLHAGLGEDLGPIVRDKTTTATRAKIKAVWDLTEAAHYNLLLALADLLGANTAPLGQPRSFYVNRAIGLINLVQNSTIPQINTAIDAAIAAGAGSTTYPADLNRMKTIHVAGAKAKLQAFNRTLAYADPYPTSRSKFDPTRITIIGPHGDYPDAATKLIEGVGFLHQMYLAGLAGYGADSLLAGYNDTYQQLKFFSLLYQKAGVMFGLLQGMDGFTDYPTEPFFRTIRALENFTHGGGGPVTPENDCWSPGDFCHASPYDFNNVKIWTKNIIKATISGSTITRPNTFNQQLEVFDRASEAWQKFDFVVWYIMTFPACEVTGGCGGK